MSEQKSLSLASALAMAVLIGLAMVASSWIIAGGFGQIAKPDRTVTVRGLAEREVNADLAVWSLRFELGGNDTEAVHKDIQEKTAVIQAFLKKYGLDETDYTIRSPEITDTSLNLYATDKPAFRYFASETIFIRSSKIDKIKQASVQLIELTSQGIVLAADYDTKPAYEFIGLNAIKPEMIGEATQNARSAASKFASDSGSSVGKIKNATQGYFSIDKAAPGLDDKKKIRVVTTVEYILND